MFFSVSKERKTCFQPIWSASLLWHLLLFKTKKLLFDAFFCALRVHCVLSALVSFLSHDVQVGYFILTGIFCGSISYNNFLKKIYIFKKYVFSKFSNRIFKALDHYIFNYFHVNFPVSSTTINSTHCVNYVSLIIFLIVVA